MMHAYETPPPMRMHKIGNILTQETKIDQIHQCA